MNYAQPPSQGLLDINASITEGTVIPQMRWVPADEADYRRHVLEAVLQLPVFFVNRNGSVGFWLPDILEGRDGDLYNRDSQAPLGGRTTTHIRINVSPLSLSSHKRHHPCSSIPFTVARMCRLATPDTSTRRDAFA